MIKYAITDPSFFNRLDSKKSYLKNLENLADFVLFRDKESINYDKDAVEFLELNKNLGFKKIIHQNYNLASRLKADGVHLNSKQFLDITKAKKLSLLTIISTHTLEEIKEAKRLGADIVTFSPIFDTPNKGKAKGIDEFKLAVDCCGIRVIALGGVISQKQIEAVKNCNAYGFASIRYFNQFRE